MKKKLTAVVAVGALCLGLSACASSTTTAKTNASSTTAPHPVYTQVATTSPTPTPPLATTVNTLLWPVYMTAYEVKGWTAVDGCGCAAPGNSTAELFPKGSGAWAFRVELHANDAYADMTGASSFNTTGMSMTATWGAGVPVPVEVKEGTALAKTLGLTDRFNTVLQPAQWPWGTTRSYLVTVYVPRGVTKLTLALTVPPVGLKYKNNDGTTISHMDIPVPDDVAQLAYAGGGDE